MSAFDRYRNNLQRFLCPTAGQIVCLTGVTMPDLAAKTVELANAGELVGCYPHEADEWCDETDYAAEDVPVVLGQFP